MLRRIVITMASALLLSFPMSPVVGTATESAPVAAPAGAPSKVVLDWQRIALRTVYTEGASPIPAGTLYLGFTALAVHDAVQASLKRERSSEPAAVVAAAHAVLWEYFSASRANLDTDRDASLAAIAPGPAKAMGIRIGLRAAHRMILSRADDGRNDTSVVYSRPDEPGVWQPPPGGAMAVPWLGFVDPLVIRHPLRVSGPDPIDSAA
jgi:hypothetical protein